MGYITALFLSTTVQFNLPPGLLSSLCFVESKHVIQAIHHDDGGTDSIGICQIKLIASRQVGFKGNEKELLDPKVNVYYAGKYLKYQLTRYHNNILQALTAYNRGHSNLSGKSSYSTKVLTQWKYNANFNYSEDTKR